MFGRKEFIGNNDSVWVDIDSLKLADWRTTYVLKPDLEVLARSLDDYGWLQPLIVQQGTNVIIDGAHRWQVARSLSRLNKATKNSVPVIFVQCDDIDAMLMHARLNRGRGIVIAKRLSRIVQRVLRSKKYVESDIKRMFVMHLDEIDLMVDGTLLKDKNISEHKYSAAWVPIEAPASATETASIIERPPNSDG